MAREREVACLPRREALPMTRHLLPWAAALGTLPYLTLKAIWLTGGDVATTDPALVHSPTLAAFNAVTVALDLLHVVLVAEAVSVAGGLQEAVSTALAVAGAAGSSRWSAARDTADSRSSPPGPAVPRCSPGACGRSRSC